MKTVVIAIVVGLVMSIVSAVPIGMALGFFRGAGGVIIDAGEAVQAGTEAVQKSLDDETRRVARINAEELRPVVQDVVQAMDNRTMKVVYVLPAEQSASKR